MMSMSVPLVALTMFGLASVSEPGGVSAVGSTTTIPGRASEPTPSPEVSRKPGARSSTENRRNVHYPRLPTHHPSGVSSAKPGVFVEGRHRSGVTCPDPTAHQSLELGNLPEGGIAAGGRIARREGLPSVTLREDGVSGTFR